MTDDTTRADGVRDLAAQVHRAVVGLSQTVAMFAPAIGEPVLQVVIRHGATELAPIELTATTARELALALDAGTYQRVQAANHRDRLAAVTAALVELRRTGADVTVALVAALGVAVLRTMAGQPGVVRAGSPVLTLVQAMTWPSAATSDAAAAATREALAVAAGHLLVAEPASFDVNLHQAIAAAAEVSGGLDALIAGGHRESEVRQFLKASTPR